MYIKIVTFMLLLCSILLKLPVPTIFCYRKFNAHISGLSGGTGITQDLFGDCAPEDSIIEFCHTVLPGGHSRVINI